MAERKLIKTEGLIVGYAMARLGPKLLDSMGWRTWNEAYGTVSDVLEEKHNSIKLLRDEFDVFFPNGRRGWLLRDPHQSRLAILHEFSCVSDDALLEIVKNILSGDQTIIEEVVGLVSEPPQRVANVAERLLTGRLAEEYFMLACQQIIDVEPSKLLDMRQRACGYDFEASPLPNIAIEIKGLKRATGGILFTDREWTEAKYRGSDYWLILVGNLDSNFPAEPAARVFPDPTSTFASVARCNIIPSTAAVWRMQASL